jgi:hypothetical protein
VGAPLGGEIDVAPDRSKLKFLDPRQVADLKQNASKKWVFKAVDGSGASMECVLATQVAALLAEGSLRVASGDVVRATEYDLNQIEAGCYKLFVRGMEVAAAAADAGAARDQAPSAGGGGGDAEMADTPQRAAGQAQRQQQQAAAAAAGQQQGTPAAARPPFGTPGPTPSPSEE